MHISAAITPSSVCRSFTLGPLLLECLLLAIEIPSSSMTTWDSCLILSQVPIIVSAKIWEPIAAPALFHHARYHNERDHNTATCPASAGARAPVRTPRPLAPRRGSARLVVLVVHVVHVHVHHSDQELHRHHLRLPRPLHMRRVCALDRCPRRVQRLRRHVRADELHVLLHRQQQLHERRHLLGRAKVVRRRLVIIVPCVRAGIECD